MHFSFFQIFHVRKLLDFPRNLFVAQRDAQATHPTTPGCGCWRCGAARFGPLPLPLLATQPKGLEASNATRSPFARSGTTHKRVGRFRAICSNRGFFKDRGPPTHPGGISYSPPERGSEVRYPLFGVNFGSQKNWRQKKGPKMAKTPPPDPQGPWGYPPFVTGGGHLADSPTQEVQNLKKKPWFQCLGSNLGHPPAKK